LIRLHLGEAVLPLANLSGDPEQEFFAFAGLAQGYVMWGHDSVDGAEYFKRAKAAARRALELDENLAEAHAALADAAMYHEWDWEAADRAFRRAIDLNPGLAELMADSSRVPPPALASFQALYGDLDGAMKSLEHGFETRNPLMPWIGSWYDFGDLVDDPRFQDLLERLNLEVVAKPVG